MICPRNRHGISWAYPRVLAKQEEDETVVDSLRRPTQRKVRLAYSSRWVDKLQHLRGLDSRIPLLPHFGCHKNGCPSLQVIYVIRSRDLECDTVDLSCLRRLPMDYYIFTVWEQPQTWFVII